MRLHTKLKKKIKRFFGRSTYRGIIQDYITFGSMRNGMGTVVIRTDKAMDGTHPCFFQTGQYIPHMMFPLIKKS